ncbi:MAG: protein phosphatase 2C domain-containing protein [Woeseiaceae bacterium]|nr:protein phosphatase 2C domain-containing protein [Woeseiaceae bacterium]
MQSEADNPVLMAGEFDADRRETRVAGGDCIAYTRPAPDKETGNEDSVAVIPFGPEAAVLVVADGAGGLPAGKRASQTAVTTLIESLEHSIAETMLLRTAILNGIEAANQAVQALGTGSATTFTVVTIEGIAVRAYQIGDSEAMVVGQRGRLKLQTPVHSPTGFAVEAGLLDQRDALHHEDRHLVSNFLGTTDMRIDIVAATELNPRDTVFLASDGVSDNVHNDEIIERIRCGPLAKAADSVIALAAERMHEPVANQPSKPDDLSLILFRKPNRGPVRKPRAAGS